MSPEPLHAPIPPYDREAEMNVPSERERYNRRVLRQHVASSVLKSAAFFAAFAGLMWLTLFTVDLPQPSRAGGSLAIFAAPLLAGLSPIISLLLIYRGMKWGMFAVCSIRDGLPVESWRDVMLKYSGPRRRDAAGTVYVRTRTTVIVRPASRRE